jgi:hypothetical protein
MPGIRNSDSLETELMSLREDSSSGSNSVFQQDRRPEAEAAIKLQNELRTSAFDSLTMQGQRESVLEVVEEEKPLEILAENLSQENFVAALSDDDLLKILKSDFNSNWFYAKDVLTMDSWPDYISKPDHSASIALMQALVNMRGRKWSEFAAFALPKIDDAVDEKKDQISGLENADSQDNNLKIGDALGSDSVTSDVDLSLKGENTEIGVAMINSEYKNFFAVDCEPGTLFDINVYSSDWMFGAVQSASSISGVVNYIPKEEEIISAEGMLKKDNQNEVWSLVKIRRNMEDPADWADYKGEILSQISSPVEMKATLKRFSAADREYAAFEKSVELLLEEMYGATVHEMNHYELDAARMSASNRLYEEKILRVKELRIEIGQLKKAKVDAAEIESRVIELHNEIARGLTYANEVYATQGAVIHTVLGKQGAKKKLEKIRSGEDKIDGSLVPSYGDKSDINAVQYELRAELYFQSVNENIGDTLHSLNHYSKEPQYAVYRAGKYLDRLCEAATLLVGEDLAKRLSGYKALKEIGDSSVKEKGKEAGKDPMAVKSKKSFFSKFDKKTDLNGVKKMTLAFGKSVSVQHKNRIKE